MSTNRPFQGRAWALALGAALLASWCVGLFGRGYWTPDEPREADLSWRMSWQAERAVPLLAGEPFCEKPPLTYWLAGASIGVFGAAGWAARLPNLLYALVAALSVFALARRSVGGAAALVAAAAIGTLLLSYQVMIWLATDAPLLAAAGLSLLGAYVGFYAADRRERLAGYLLMHAAMGFGFLAKSAAAWMVPVLTLATLVVWERRWRELWRWELWIGAGLQGLIIGAWVWSVYRGPDGLEHLRVFFWNNLVGRFTQVDAPADLQYAAAHRNSPGKYLLELPVYLFPWTLAVAAAVARAWTERRGAADDRRAVRFAAAVTLPTLLVLSVAATARNIYFAPALPGVALLLGWWARDGFAARSRRDRIALRATALLVALSALVAGAAVALMLADATATPTGTPGALLVAAPLRAAPAFIAVISVLGAAAALALAAYAWRCAGPGRGAAEPRLASCLPALLLAYCAVLLGPAAQAYRLADRWQDLGALGRAVRLDLGTAPLVLISPDETTRAWVDMYVTAQAMRVARLPETPPDLDALAAVLGGASKPFALVQLEGRELTPFVRGLAHRLGLERGSSAAPATPAWIAAAHLHAVNRYALPNGRRYALLAPAP